MHKILFSLLFLLCSSLFASKLPEIDENDVSTILQQMMEAHVSQKKITVDLAKRALELTIEELDPVKTYFLESEVEKWLDPSSETLEMVVKQIDKKDFSAFTQIHEQMSKAVARRKNLKAKIEKSALPTDVSVKEFKDLKWAKTADELESRLLRLKALQIHSADRLEPALKEKALQRIEKRILATEDELTTTDKKERKKLVLTHALKAIAASFDTHTSYFTPLEASQFMIQVQQRLFGIGAQLRDDLNGFTIVKIIEGSPSSRTDLKINDRVIAINGEPVVGMEITDAVELIRGVDGTKVTLTVLRATSENKMEEKKEIEVIRGEVVIKEARIESKTIPFGDGVIAQISLHGFYQDPNRSSSADLYEEIMKIRNEHKLKGIILDLRDNSGGVLPQAVAVTGLFITKGVVVGIKDNTGHVEFLREINGKTVWDGPLVVLTSKGSASASEIVAQTLQDYGRALVIGDEHTYGKGTFQTFTLDAASNGKVNPKGEFKVTRGRYYTVSGKSPQLVGVHPDIVVPGPYSFLDIGEKHAKCPLANDQIPENFRDDLSDIPVAQREQVSWLYRFNLQPQLKTYTRCLPKLQENSELRLKENALYQSFLTQLKKEEEEELSTSTLELYSKADLQLTESINVMKDLIVLLNE